MPARVVRSEINTSASLARCGEAAELLFLKLILEADDYGRLDARIPLLRARCYPLRPEVTDADVRERLLELSTCDPGGTGPILLYEVAGRPFLQVVTWEIKRGKGRRAKVSKYPGPPDLELLEGGQLVFADERRRRAAGDPRAS
jgi:hypothetical protein